MSSTTIERPTTTAATAAVKRQITANDQRAQGPRLPGQLAPLVTRRPTGLATWPVLLLAGVPKCGKSYASAVATSSKHVGRTLWVGIGEQDPDELGSLPGVDFEIVEHDGTYRGILDAIRAAVAEPPADPERPTLIVADSISNLWDLLSRMAQVEMTARIARKREAALKYGRNPGPEQVEPPTKIDNDLWNTAADRWDHIMETLGAHRGPVLLTARLEQVSVFDDQGNITKDKMWKVQAQKRWPFWVTAFVEMMGRGQATLKGVTSHRVKFEGETTLAKDWTVEGIWRGMGLFDGGPIGHRTYSRTDTGEEVDKQRAEILADIRALDLDTAAVAGQWKTDHGHPITETTDLGGLALLRDDLRTQATRVEPPKPVQDVVTPAVEPQPADPIADEGAPEEEPHRVARRAVRCNDADVLVETFKRAGTEGWLTVDVTADIHVDYLDVVGIEPGRPLNFGTWLLAAGKYIRKSGGLTIHEAAYPEAGTPEEN